MQCADSSDDDMGHKVQYEAKSGDDMRCINHNHIIKDVERLLLHPIIPCLRFILHLVFLAIITASISAYLLHLVSGTFIPTSLIFLLLFHCFFCFMLQASGVLHKQHIYLYLHETISYYTLIYMEQFARARFD